MTTRGISNTSKDYDELFKIVLIGDSGVGKTSMLQRFAEQYFSGKYQEISSYCVKDSFFLIKKYF